MIANAHRIVYTITSSAYPYGFAVVEWAMGTLGHRHPVRPRSNEASLLGYPILVALPRAHDAGDSVAQRPFRHEFRRSSPGLREAFSTNRSASGKEVIL